MDLLFYFFIFLVGAAFGSFINVLVFRYNTGESLVRSRSKCFACGKILSAWELIPVFSFLFLKGRCRNCQSKISRQYPLVEIITGVVFLLFFLKWRKDFSLAEIEILIFWLMAGAILIAISFYDLRHKIIPDAFSYSLFSLAVLGNIFLTKTDFKEIFLSLLPALFLFSLWFFSKGRWMGLGDAKLMAGGGIFLGFPQSLTSLVCSFWIGAAAGIFLLLASSKTTLKSEIPFGPFLAIGIITAFLIPESVIFFEPLYIFYG